MNKMKLISKYKILIIVALVCTSFSMQTAAQQDPMYSQYMFNTLPINPAYAGSREMLSVMVLGRKQWVGFEGAPTTATLSVHSPVYKEMALGGTVVYDEYGPAKQTSFFVDYAYHLKLGETMKLSFGLSGGFQGYSTDFKGLYKETYSDNAYSSAVEQLWMPNFGFGLFLYSHQFYFGASIPRILENSFKDTDYSNGSEVRHYYGLTGVVIPVNKNLIFRPSLMARMAEGSPLSVDFNIYSILYQKFWIGAMYRLNDSFGAMAQVQISQQFKLGYAFDLTTNELSSVNSGSHEIMLTYDFCFDKNKFFNPRYF